MINTLKFAVRNLRRSPGFVVTAIITLALGIGVNAVVFGVMNALVLRPVNVPHAQNLYMVQRYRYPSQSYLDYKDLRDRNRTFESMAAFQIIGPVGVDTGGDPSTRGPIWPAGIISMRWAFSRIWDGFFMLPMREAWRALLTWC